MKKHQLEEYFINNHRELFNKMKECDHGDNNNLNPYHLEGSVWNHTQMVLDILGDETNSTLLVAALLHDIGKPFVKTVEDNKVWFKGHPNRGTIEAIDIVKDIKENLSDFSDVNIIYTLNLINLHHLFFNYLQSGVTDNIAQKLYKKLKYFDYEFIYLLYKLCMADHQGRIISANINSDQFIYLFSLVNSLFYNINQNLSESKKYSAEVIFNVGIPYSGKSYNSINYSKNYTIISRDDLITEKFKQYAYHEAWELVNHNIINTELMNNLKKAIQNKENIIIDMTNVSRKSRNIKRCLFPASYKKIANVYYTGLNTIKNRIEKRVDKYVPRDVVEKMMNSYNTPLYDEFDEINFIVQ